MSGRGRHPQRNAHWTGQPCCTDFLHCSGTCSYLTEASRLVKNCGLHILGFEWACAGASPPSSSGRHTNHAPSLLIRFSSGRAPTSTWVTARWVPTRSVLFTAKMDTVVRVLSCFYVHWQVSASLPKPDAWPLQLSPIPTPQLTLALPWPFPPNSGLKKLQLQSSLQNIANCCALPVTWSYLLKEAKTKPISNIALQLLKSFTSSSNSQGSRD